MRTFPDGQVRSATTGGLLLVMEEGEEEERYRWRTGL
jgi:hypothetical protein